MTVEFTCEGCGWHVFRTPEKQPPKDGFCVNCSWINENVGNNLEEFWRIYNKIQGERRS